MAFYVYLMASNPYGTLYCGSTDDLARRAWEHREKILPGFTGKYGVTRLVWYEVGESRESVLIKEKQIKNWNRAWKIRLIEEANPKWLDLYEALNGTPVVSLALALWTHDDADA